MDDNDDKLIDKDDGFKTILPANLGTLNEKLLPFTRNTNFNSCISQSEFIQIYSEFPLQSEQLSFRAPLQSGVFYDLSQSFFEFTIQCSYNNGTPYNWAPDQWQPPNSGLNWFGMCLFHSVLRLSDFQIKIQDTIVSDGISADAFAYKEFAKHLILTPYNSVQIQLDYEDQIPPIDNAKIACFDSDRDYAFADGIVSDKNTSFPGPTGTGAITSAIGAGDWILGVREYIACHYNPTANQCFVTVRFQPSDGFWRNPNYLPGTVPMQFLLTSRNDNNANFWYQAYSQTSPSFQFFETITEARLILRQIRPTDNALQTYNKLMDEAGFLRYTVLHAELISAFIPLGSSTWQQTGFFPNKKPQLIIIHVVPSEQLIPNPAAAQRSHPFGNSSASTGDSFQLLGAYVTYGGIQYPKQNIYTPSKYDGTCLDYAEYIQQCKVMMNGPTNVKTSPFLTLEQYYNQHYAVTLYNLQNNGDTIHDRTQTDLHKGALNINFSFNPTLVDYSVFITAFTNDTITIDSQGNITKSFL